MVIDCHCHFTSAPAAHGDWRADQLGALESGTPVGPYPVVPDEEIRESIEAKQLATMRERGVDLTVFSPRASAMGHHLGDEAANIVWARACNDLVHRVVELFPDDFAGAGQLPQFPGAPSPHGALAGAHRSGCAAVATAGLRRAPRAGPTRPCKGKGTVKGE